MNGLWLEIVKPLWRELGGNNWKIESNLLHMVWSVSVDWPGYQVNPRLSFKMDLIEWKIWKWLWDKSKGLLNTPLRHDSNSEKWGEDRNSKAPRVLISKWNAPYSRIHTEPHMDTTIGVYAPRILMAQPPMVEKQWSCHDATIFHRNPSVFQSFSLLSSNLLSSRLSLSSMPLNLHIIWKNFTSVATNLLHLCTQDGVLVICIKQYFPPVYIIPTFCICTWGKRGIQRTSDTASFWSPLTHSSVFS